MNGPLPKFRTYKMVFFHQNLVKVHTKIQDLHEGLSFHQKLLRDLTKIHDIQKIQLGGSFFHQNLVADSTKIQNIQEGLSFFDKNLVADRTEFQDLQQGLSVSPEFGRRPYQNSNIQEGLSFSPEFGCRPYQISGHRGESFFFTRIWLQTVPKFKTYRRVFLIHQNQVRDRTKIHDTLVTQPMLQPTPN